MAPPEKPEENLEHDLDEFEERIEHLDDRLEDAQRKLDRLARERESGASVPADGGDSS